MSFDRVEVRVKRDELTREVYSFWYHNGVLWLDSYLIEQRKDKKARRYTTVSYYHRLYQRKNNIRVDDVPLPEEVKQMAIESFIRGIEVRKWPI